MTENATPAIQSTLVPFHDQQILVIQQGDTVYVPIKPLCQNLGVDWEAQRQRIARDTVLSEGACIIQAPSKGGLQDMMCLPMEYLNGWLFGIDDKKLENIKIRERLLIYKRECYGALYSYFSIGFAVDDSRVLHDPFIPLTHVSAA